MEPPLTILTAIKGLAWVMKGFHEQQRYKLPDKKGDITRQTGNAAPVNPAAALARAALAPCSSPAPAPASQSVGGKEMAVQIHKRWVGLTDQDKERQWWDQSGEAFGFGQGSAGLLRKFNCPQRSRVPRAGGLANNRVRISGRKRQAAAAAGYDPSLHPVRHMPQTQICILPSQEESLPHVPPIRRSYRTCDLPNRIAAMIAQVDALHRLKQQGLVTRV